MVYTIASETFKDELATQNLTIAKMRTASLSDERNETVQLFDECGILIQTSHPMLVREFDELEKAYASLR